MIVSGAAGVERWSGAGKWVLSRDGFGGRAFTVLGFVGSRSDGRLQKGGGDIERRWSRKVRLVGALG